MEWVQINVLVKGTEHWGQMVPFDLESACERDMVISCEGRNRFRVLPWIYSFLHRYIFSSSFLSLCDIVGNTLMGYTKGRLMLPSHISVLSSWPLVQSKPVSTKIINKKSTIGIENNFIWVKLRTIAWETASQITLRNCSREAWLTSNKSQIFCFKV